MTPGVKVILDSISQGVRLTTFEVVCPVHTWTHVLTHRALSRNAQSHRAIPVAKLIEKATYTPTDWGAKGKGMAPTKSIEDLSTIHQLTAEWDAARQNAIATARRLDGLGLHKELANRVLSPFLYVTALVSATEWTNFLALRADVSSGVQGDTFDVASAIKTSLAIHTPTERTSHFPFVTGTEWEKHKRGPSLSAARCARVSYTSHDGEIDLDKDLELADTLTANKHYSPFEHVAMSYVEEDVKLNYANYRAPWIQWRHFEHRWSKP